MNFTKAINEMKSGYRIGHPDRDEVWKYENGHIIAYLPGRRGVPLTELDVDQEKLTNDVLSNDWIVLESGYIEDHIKMDFSKALRKMKEGYLLSRKKWDSLKMSVAYRAGYLAGVTPNEETKIVWRLTDKDTFHCKPYLQIRNKDDTYDVYTPTTEDILAEDWFVLK